MMTWVLFHPEMTPEHLGLLPRLFSDTDPRSARDQLDENYAYGGGWNPERTSRWQVSDNRMTIQYPGDPPLRAVACALLRDEFIFLFPHSMLAIVQADGAYEIGRVD